MDETPPSTAGVPVEHRSYAAARDTDSAEREADTGVDEGDPEPATAVDLTDTREDADVVDGGWVQV